MSKPILVGYDPRRADRTPVDFGAAMASVTGAPLVVLSVQSGISSVPFSADWHQHSTGQVDNELLADCHAAVEQLEVDLQAKNIPVTCRVLQSTSAARALHEAAEKDDAGLLVVGSSRQSTRGRTLLGSTAVRLMHGSPCPVGVVPSEWQRLNTWPSVIGVAYVDSPEGNEALRGAHALAVRAGAALRVITAVKLTPEMYLEVEPRYVAGQTGKDLEDVEGEHRLHVEKEVRRTVEAMYSDVPAEIDVTVGDPADVLIGASHHLDLLVCGSRAYGPLRSVLLGSISRRICAEAHCPVIVVPRGVNALLEALVEPAEGAMAPA
jgi:nucleotide-binding universal stress UspA family protein